MVPKAISQPRVQLLASRTDLSNLAIVAVECPELEVIAVGDVEENVLAPDDGRGTSAAGHVQFPGDVIGWRPI